MTGTVVVIFLADFFEFFEADFVVVFFDPVEDFFDVVFFLGAAIGKIYEIIHQRYSSLALFKE